MDLSLQVPFVSMNTAQKPSNNKGFTLIESLIALLIIGIALSSLLGSYAQNARYLLYAKNKTVSKILINNLIVEKRLGPKLSVGHSDDSIKFGKKTWYWTAVVSKFQLEKILQVQMNLYASKADKESKQPTQSQKFYVQE